MLRCVLLEVVLYLLLTVPAIQHTLTLVFTSATAELGGPAQRVHVPHAVIDGLIERRRGGIG